MPTVRTWYHFNRINFDPTITEFSCCCLLSNRFGPITGQSFGPDRGLISILLLLNLVLIELFSILLPPPAGALLELAMATKLGGY